MTKFQEGFHPYWPGGDDGGDGSSSSGANVFTVNVTYDDEMGVATCDKTAGEMWSVALDGVVLFVAKPNEGETDITVCTKFGIDESGYYFAGDNIELFADSASDYPSTESSAPPTD